MGLLVSFAVFFHLAGLNAQSNVETVHLAYVEWSSEIASTNLVKAIIEEKLNYRCRLLALSAGEMWQAVATGEVDAMVSAWLPETHAHFYSQVKDSVVNLGPNLEGTKIGLVVPNVTSGRLTAGTGIRNRPYMNIESIPELKKHHEKLNNRIIGIDPEAGIMRKTRLAMQAYDLDKFRLIEGSEVSMIAELSSAIRHQKWIVVTGWLPHWMFARWELKFLADPQDIYGSGGHISTIVRKGLQEDMPEIYRFLDNFHWNPEEMGQLMLWIQENEGRYPYEKALRWIRTHPERVNSWLE
ncbi:MAG: glycine betaine ABC transporter substrate-binding protein [Gammaproteobacteria bacterium]|nr:glycine betaine ABC transporter substrate-binding protein [Gammaproteobacteria bacterium]NIW44256.1 glycine/betaine ABC transporter substrate-binding protein [Gammaproteobacteria bacterium]NIX01516.1 glycine/betaine ABC transporter substrate-binding protein [Phycisphaerae bacterium]